MSAPEAHPSHQAEVPPEVLQQYGWTPGEVRLRRLAEAGGFSGAVLYQVESPQGRFCLKRHEPGLLRADQLAWIHAVLEHAAAQGIGWLARPVLTRGGVPFVECRGAFWELTPWMPGRADFHCRPSRARTQAALRALARFHLAVATFPDARASGYPPAVLRRREALRRLQRLAQEAIPWKRVADTEVRRSLQSLWPRALERLPELLREEAAVARLTVPLVPCIRDVWDAHVFFQGEEVVGLIDFAGMGLDTVATDLARLLGSMTCPGHPWWAAGVEAYEQLRRLDSSEQRLLSWLDRSLVVAAVGTWVRRLCLEQRQYPTGPLLQRLRWLQQRLGRTP